MEIVICAIARRENLYVEEWVNYHLSMGFSHIYLYDNNRDGEERISDVLADTDRVTIIPYHDVENWPQMQAYEDCWRRFIFDWCLFIDVDEFFTFGQKWNGAHDVVSFIETKAKAEVILLNWMTYGDNGKLEYEAQPVIKRFPTPLPLSFSASNMFGKQPINGLVKSFVKHTADYQPAGPHVGQGSFSCCNADGEFIENKAWQQNQTYGTAYIRHYITKSLSEYLSGKISRGLADRESGSKYHISNYFIYNKPTLRKLLVFYKAKNNGYKKEIITLKWWIKQYVKHYIITPLFVR